MNAHKLSLRSFDGSQKKIKDHSQRKTILKEKILINHYKWRSDNASCHKSRSRSRRRLRSVRGELTRSLAESNPSYRPFPQNALRSCWCCPCLCNFQGGFILSWHFLELHIGRSQLCFLVRRLVLLEISGWVNTSSHQLSCLFKIVMI